jgi:hypothetical protein
MLPDINTMTPINTEQLLADFDGILDRVEAGECFLIQTDGAALVLIPYNEDTRMLFPESSSS